ncbi:MAG: S8 family serine peptidase [Methanotrichaceae archaeon]
MDFIHNIRGEASAKEIKIKRGEKEITFLKSRSKFSVRLKYGTAQSVNALKSRCGPLDVLINHVESLPIANMDIFEVDDPAKLDASMDTLRNSPEIDVVSHVYKMDDNPGSEVIPTGKLTLQFKPGVAAAEKEKIMAEFGLEVLKDLDFLPNSHTVKTSKSSKDNPLKTALKLQQKKEIQSADPDITFKIEFLYRPPGSIYELQWHLKNRGDLLCTAAGADVGAEEAWDYTKGSRDIIICMMDDGFDLLNPEFNIKGKIAAPMDFVEKNFSLDQYSDDDNHGTACAGIALAEETGTGAVGLAPACALMPIRIPAVISDDLVVAIFQYAIDNNADIISCSWKARADFFPLSTAVNAIIQKVVSIGRKNKKGCAIFFAAGNDDAPLNGTKDGRRWLNGFAVHPGVIAVGASNSRDERAYYSNYGPELAVCAPSGGGPKTRCIVTAIGSYSISRNLPDASLQFEGTSASASMASGLAGLILAINPGLTSVEIKKIIVETADKIDKENGQYVNGHSPLYGYGRINAHQAVKSSTNRPVRG